MEPKLPWLARLAVWLYRARCGHYRDLPMSATERFLQEDLQRVREELRLVKQELEECKSTLKLRELELKNTLEIVERDRLRAEAESKIAAAGIAVSEQVRGR